MPLKKAVSDITEIQCSDGKLYVSAVLDCFNGEILALAMDDNMKKELCVKTIEQMKEQFCDYPRYMPQLFIQFNCSNLFFYCISFSHF